MCVCVRACVCLNKVVKEYLWDDITDADEGVLKLPTVLSQARQSSFHLTCWIVLRSVAVKGEYLDPHCDGKQVIVHLFEWKWTDIAAECERYLGPKGFCGVQVSPPHEHVVITSPPAPWWQRYQPVSYKLVSRIYADVVVNHMAGAEQSGRGSGGTSFDGSTLSYPGVPYSAQNFNPRSKCPSGDGHVNNYGDPNNVRNCYLLSLTDLDQSQDYVRGKIVDYYNSMLDLGVAGFRVDASKHMWPQDLAAIQGATKDTQFGGKPFYMHEVIDQNDGAIKSEFVQVNEYYGLGRVTEFRYCQKITEGERNFGSLQGVVDYGWGMADNDHALIFVDNHDNQRGHGGGGQLLTHKQPDAYKLATAFTLAWNYGFTRVMSSYSFGDNSDQGPPHNADYSTADVPINSDGSCGGGWVCEHRWPSIGNMAAFRNAVAGTDVRHYHQEGDVVGFARGNKGFFAMGKGGFDKTFQTGLPAGQYCDLISDCRVKVTVDGGGNAHVRPENNHDPVVAFIVGCTNDAASSACAIPIRHRDPGNNQHFAKVKAWSKGDNYLDWFGDHYWLVDVDMDCSKTENSYFEVKAMVGGWESDIPSNTCTTVTREELTAELGKLTTKLTQLEDRLTAKRAEETEKLGKEIGQALGQTLGQTMIVGLEKLGQAMTVGLEKLGQTMTASVQKLGEAFATRDGVSKPVDSPGNQSVGFSGSVYVRWGSQSCPGGAENVYAGVVGGGHYSHTGAGVNALCLTKDPVYDGRSKTTMMTYLYGAEYATTPEWRHNLDVVCAVCRVPFETTMMIPGTNTCLPGWTRQYRGYLMAGRFNVPSGTEFVCMDRAMEADHSSYRDDDGKLFHYVIGKCGSLPCPPYKEGKVVTCVVCAK
nr:hypothetical protein BaRGS_026115 [Batillaria attramentaria]